MRLNFENHEYKIMFDGIYEMVERRRKRWKTMKKTNNESYSSMNRAAWFKFFQLFPSFQNWFRKNSQISMLKIQLNSPKFFSLPY